jgi:sugar phosphate isomerase/epimerase
MKFGLHSISYSGSWGQDRLELVYFIQRAAQLGYHTVLLAGKRPQLSPLDMDDDRVAELDQALKAANVTCAVVAAYNDFGTKVSPDIPFVEMQVEYLQSLCRIAARLGASYLRVFTAYLADGQDFYATWQRTVSALREIADRAGRYGITIAVQNHHDLAVDTSVLVELLGDINRSNCKLAFDAWSPALRGEDLYEAAKLAAPHTVITTNADYIQQPRFRYRPELINYEPVMPANVRAVPFGTGGIDYVNFFRGLRDGGFDGIASYEMCSPLRGGGSVDNLDRNARHYLTWMEEHVCSERGITGQ